MNELLFVVGFVLMLLVVVTGWYTRRVNRQMLRERMERDRRRYGGVE